MKKFFAFLITFIYLTVNAGFAFSELYYLKNTNETVVKNIVADEFASQGFSIVNTNPYYAVSGDDYAVIVVQQSGQNVFYYYNSEDNKKLNKNILRTIKSYDIEYEQSLNSNALNIYDNITQKLLTTNQVNNYTFEEVPVNLNVKAVGQIQQPSALKGYVAQIESGTTLKIYLQSSVNTSTAQKDDEVIAVVMDNLNYNGYTVIPQGSVVYGTLTKARHATYGSRNGRVVIEFNKIVTPDNKTYDISAEKIDFTVTNDGKFSRTVSGAVVGAALGAVTGLLFAAIAGSNYGSAAAIGAGVGAGSSLIGSGAEHGVDAEIPTYTEMEIILKKPIRATVSY